MTNYCVVLGVKGMSEHYQIDLFDLLDHPQAPLQYCVHIITYTETYFSMCWLAEVIL